MQQSTPDFNCAGQDKASYRSLRGLESRALEADSFGAYRLKIPEGFLKIARRFIGGDENPPQNKNVP